MKIKDIPQGKIFINYVNNIPNNINIKLHDDLFFHAMTINASGDWIEMKSSFAYSYEQITYNKNENKGEIIKPETISNIRIQEALKYIFEKMRA